MKTKAELMDILKDHLEDEMEDVDTYLDLAEDARENNCPYLEKALKMIANDEYSHARYIKKYLKDHHDHDLTHELKAKFDEVTRRIWD